MQIFIPEYVRAVLARLRGAGFLAYPVGGCVRDALLGREPHDWDVATSALPRQAMLALADVKIVETGLKHGTITAVVNGEHVEITTFRADGEYLDGRRPSSVTLGAPLERDLARRDFTVNAMALGESGIIDPFGGQSDLRQGVIRAVGEPGARFGEDGLRILRALRFAAQLGFEIEPETARAARESRDMLRKIAGERIREELARLLEAQNAARVLREYADIVAVFLPEIAPAIGFQQNNPHHHLDVWQHTLAAVDAAPRDWRVRLALLLHDLGKPLCYSEDGKGTGHFYGHAGIGFKIAQDVTARLRLDGESAGLVRTLVKYHDADLFASEKSVARWLSRLGERDLRLLLDVKRADNAAQSPVYRGRLQELAAAGAALEHLLEINACVSLKDLAVNGDDIMEIGASGRKIGEILSALLSDVIGGDVQNEKSALMNRARELM